MPKFRFNLEKVLGYRQVVQSLAQKDFELAMSLLREQEEILESLKQARHQAFTQRYDFQMKGLGADSLVQVQDYIKGQDIRINAQELKIQEIQKQVEILRDQLRDRAIDTKIIERLKERKQEDFRLEQRKHEQKSTDDLTSTRFAGRDESDENGI